MRSHAFRRLGPTAAVALASLAVLSSPPAFADAARPDPQLPRCSILTNVPQGFRKIADTYFTCELCFRDGDYGLAHGSWTDYRCKLYWAGLDVFAALYVYP
ncbi:hypothetical protein [Actinomadura sp. NEAU-AAG7]|uniref:hypothetical protein n=1 Tax=Actinomadura sp. NEAU-AAG7 TaxID=2839640 RepID=UPI001BE4898B|nr:hypothetical protein [Actinomadura sp. NEAU-AAG7]MBT2207923.1 hypothetical protein [Actinomadura sp. NEAU-AAG7]